MVVLMTAPPIEDWINHGHKVDGADPHTARYRRQLPDGNWQWWHHLTEQWAAEGCQPPANGETTNMTMYPEETLSKDHDDGTMPSNVATLAEAVIGRRIVSADMGRWGTKHWPHNNKGLILTLDDGSRVRLADTDDCCAYTETEEFLLNVGSIDHMIMGVGTTDGYSTWHIFADFGDVMEMKVGWSCGNPFYYGYGFDITVEPAE